MKLTVLVDNNTLIDKYYLGEPGLSFYIEDNEVKLTSTSNLEIKLKDEKKKVIVRKEK